MRLGSGSVLTGKQLGKLYEGSTTYTADDETRSCRLIPGSTFLLCWELVSFAMLMYTALAVPFSLAFASHDRWDPSEPSTYLETVVDIFFIADIVRNCFTAFYDRGNLITNQWRIVANYARTWLIVDVIASFPLDWFAANLADDEGGQLLLLLRLSKLWKLLRLLRLWRVGLRSKVDSGTVLAEYALAITSSTSFWFVSHACLVGIAVHVNGCCLLYTSPSPRDGLLSRMPSSA